MKVNKRKAMALGFAFAFLTMASAAVITLDRGVRKKRRFAVRPINRKRASQGLFATLIKDMALAEFDEDQFFKYTRMTKQQFSHLVRLVKPHVKKDPTKKPISTEERLIMTLHYLSEGSSMQDLAWNYRIGKTTARNIIVEMCEVIWNVLSPTELPSPSRDDFEKVSHEYLGRWNVPNCIGAVDGKHINMKSPMHSGSEFFNYKKTFSIVLMATCDAYYRFTMVDIGAAGSNHDGYVFKNSGFGKMVLNGTLPIPPPKMLPKSNKMMSHFFIGDAAFPLHQNIIRPYPGQHLGEKKNTFNYRISRARRTIESAFGILSQRLRILRRTLETSVEVCELITQATVVLHNYLRNSELTLPASQRKYCPTGYADHITEDGEFVPGRWREEGNNLRSVNRLRYNNATNLAKGQRNLLAEYFVSREGWVPWQEDYVHRGGLPTA